MGKRDGKILRRSAVKVARWARTHAKSCKLETTFAFFYSFELKLGRMVELCIPKILRFLFFDFNGFWRENDVTRLTAKLKFQDMATKINNFERTLRDRNKCVMTWMIAHFILGIQNDATVNLLHAECMYTKQTTTATNFKAFP